MNQGLEKQIRVVGVRKKNGLDLKLTETKSNGHENTCRQLINYSVSYTCVS